MMKEKKYYKTYKTKASKTDLTFFYVELYHAHHKIKNKWALGADGVVREATQLGKTIFMSKIFEVFNLKLYNPNIPTLWNDSLTILLDERGDKTILKS